MTDAVPAELAAALSERSAASGVAIVCGRTAAVLCRVRGGVLEPPPGAAVPGDVYEVRVALHDGGHDGELRFLAPGRVAHVPAPGGEAVHRVLMGTAVAGGAGASGDGWVRLREARIGDVLVPYDGPAPAQGARFALSVERVLREDEDGNVHVVDEVLRGVVALTGPGRAGDDDVRGAG